MSESTTRIKFNAKFRDLYQKVGTMVKLGARRKNWLRRVFALDTNKKQLLYFASVKAWEEHSTRLLSAMQTPPNPNQAINDLQNFFNSGHVKGIIDLAQGLVYVVDFDDEKYTLEISVQKPSPRHFFLRVDSQAALFSWIAELSTCGLVFASASPHNPWHISVDSSPYTNSTIVYGKQGFLSKRGYFNRSFKRRFFRIGTDALTGLQCLAYFARMDDVKPKGIIPLHGAVVMVPEAESLDTNTQKTFAVEDPNEFTRQFSLGTPDRTFVLLADSVQEKEIWMAVLRQFCELEKGEPAPAMELFAEEPRADEVVVRHPRKASEVLPVATSFPHVEPMINADEDEDAESLPPTVVPGMESDSSDESDESKTSLHRAEGFVHNPKQPGEVSQASQPEPGEVDSRAAAFEAEPSVGDTNGDAVEYDKTKSVEELERVSSFHKALPKNNNKAVADTWLERERKQYHSGELTHVRSQPSLLDIHDDSDEEKGELRKKRLKRRLHLLKERDNMQSGQGHHRRESTNLQRVITELGSLFESVLTEGGVVIKHGRKGKPHKKKLFAKKMSESIMHTVSGDNFDWEADHYTDVFWCPPRSKTLAQSRKRCMRLDPKCTEILVGKKTEVFLRSTADNVDEDLCFSIYNDERSLDIQVNSVDRRDEWVDALEWCLQQASKYQS